MLYTLLFLLLSYARSTRIPGFTTIAAEIWSTRQDLCEDTLGNCGVWRGFKLFSPGVGSWLMPSVTATYKYLFKVSIIPKSKYKHKAREKIHKIELN